MAGLQHNWPKTLAFAVLLMGAETAGFTQSQQTLPAEDQSTGSLTGKLTDLHSRPLEGVAVVVSNQATGAETRTITTKNGAYRFSGLEPGEYTVTAESSQLGRGQLQDIVVAAGYETRVQTAMELSHSQSSPVLTALLDEVQPKVEERPWVNRHFVEPEALPENDVALNAEPVRLLPLNGQWVRAAITHITVCELNAALETEPLGVLLLRGQWVRAAITSTTTFELYATQESEPLQTYTLAGQSLPNSVQPAPVASPVIGRAAPALSNTISVAELQALPVSGRRWQDFLLDNTPTSTTPAGGQGEISLRGAGQPAEVAVDGVSRGLAFGRTNDSVQGSQGRGPLGQGEYPAGMAQVGKGGHGLVLSEAAIRTVETVAGNVEAAADRAAGGRMNVETQHGAGRPGHLPPDFFVRVASEFGSEPFERPPQGDFEQREGW